MGTNFGIGSAHSMSHRVAAVISAKGGHTKYLNIFSSCHYNGCIHL